MSKSPKEPASNYKEYTTKKGLDGRIYMVKSNRWVKTFLKDEINDPAVVKIYYPNNSKRAIMICGKDRQIELKVNDKFLAKVKSKPKYIKKDKSHAFLYGDLYKKDYIYLGLISNKKVDIKYQSDILLTSTYGGDILVHLDRQGEINSLIIDIGTCLF